MINKRLKYCVSLGKTKKSTTANRITKKTAYRRGGKEK